jgi:hypothetical protein
LAAAPRHAKRGTPATRLRAPALAAVTLAGLTAVILVLSGGSSAHRPSRATLTAPTVGSALAIDQVSATLHRDVAVTETRTIQRAKSAARREHLAALAAARRRAASQPPPPSPTTSPTPAPSSGGGADAARSPLGVCIRNAEEGGSYAWGPGNGGGAYQFLLSTWENYGGAASQFGVAGPAYQDQIFDNAIAAGGASNWTDYDGC